MEWWQRVNLFWWRLARVRLKEGVFGTRQTLGATSALGARATGFGHRLPTGNGESAALNCAAHSANYSISCGHPMAEPGSLF